MKWPRMREQHCLQILSSKNVWKEGKYSKHKDHVGNVLKVTKSRSGCITWPWSKNVGREGRARWHHHVAKYLSKIFSPYSFIQLFFLISNFRSINSMWLYTTNGTSWSTNSVIHFFFKIEFSWYHTCPPQTYIYIFDDFSNCYSTTTVFF